MTIKNCLVCGNCINRTRRTKLRRRKNDITCSHQCSKVYLNVYCYIRDRKIRVLTTKIKKSEKSVLKEIEDWFKKPVLKRYEEDLKEKIKEVFEE